MTAIAKNGIDDQMPHILVVDDDTRLRDLLQQFLSIDGYRVSTAKDAADARSQINAIMFDLIVLDIMMPGESGLELALDLRKSLDVPILMLTAMGNTEDRIAGLEAGADDYLGKPFEPRELTLRIDSILRRAQQPPDAEPPYGAPDSASPESGGGQQLAMGPCLFDRRTSILTRDNETVRLTGSEQALMAVLAAHPGEVLSREELARLTGNVQERSIDVQITRLRRKIEDDQRNPRFLQTIRGKGYVLWPDETC